MPAALHIYTYFYAQIVYVGINFFFLSNALLSFNYIMEITECYSSVLSKLCPLWMK